MKHPRNVGSIFVRLTTINGTAVSILPNMISFVAEHCDTTKVFIEGRAEALEVRQGAGVVRRLIRRAFRNLILLGLIGRFPFNPFFAGQMSFPTGFPFGGECEEECDDDDSCEDDVTPTSTPSNTCI